MGERQTVQRPERVTDYSGLVGGVPSLQFLSLFSSAGAPHGGLSGRRQFSEPESNASYVAPSE